MCGHDSVDLLETVGLASEVAGKGSTASRASDSSTEVEVPDNSIASAEQEDSSTDTIAEPAGSN